MNIALICALEREINELFPHLENARQQRVGPVAVTSGAFCGHQIHVAVCGIGKVAAAMAAQAVILRFSPDAVLNIGLAGSADARLRPGDAVVATKIVYHDFDFSLSHSFDDMKDGILPDARLRELAKNACTQSGIDHIDGVVATGDQFIQSTAVKNDIVARTGCACVEMEAAAIAYVAFKNGVPFATIKVVSDAADETAQSDFDFSIEQYCEHSAAVMRCLFGML